MIARHIIIYENSIYQNEIQFLPMVLGKRKNEKEIDPFYFKTSARITKLLGSESLSDHLVAITELIKNSYDADATDVVLEFHNLKGKNATLVITDNGDGIDAIDIQGTLMTIGTDKKIHSEYTKTHKRKKIGHKGIGRFAFETLAERAIITSHPKNKTSGVEIEFDWNRYTNEKSVNDIPNTAKMFEKAKSNHGLEIQLIGLRHEWSKTDIRKLKQQISMIMPPNMKFGKFNIHVIAKDISKTSEKLSSSILSQAVYKFVGKLNKNNTASYTIYSKKGKKKTFRETDEFKGFQCGSVEFIIYFYYREQSLLDAHGVQIDVDTLSDILDDYGGVKIYRDGMRVTGYGDDTDDWIRLDALKVNKSSIPSNNQIIGIVKITSDGNPNIVDTTTREGIKHGTPYHNLKQFMQKSLKIFAAKRKEIEGKKSKSKTTKKTRTKTSKTTRTTDVKFLETDLTYPNRFYKNLEEEINKAYENDMPTACMVLSRKMIENLMDNILEKMFPKRIEVRFLTGQNARRHDFYLLRKHLMENKGNKRLKPDQIQLLKKIDPLLEPFRKEANKNSHYIIEFYDEIEKVEKTKVVNIIEMLLMVWSKF